MFPDGSAIDVDEFSSVEFEGPTLLRVTSGRVRLFAAGANNPASAVQFQIDTPVASAQTDGPGEYRVAILGGPSGLQTEMAVIRGAGALVTEVGTVPLRAGERSVAWDNAAPSRPQVFNSARYDAFDQWALALRDQRLGPRSQSAQYLPADLRMYGGELDRNGSWDYDASYGYVWYPTVASDWRPYYDGYWSAVPTYGWTWIGIDAWSWPTHHYGRWGFARSRWFWIPDRRWAPAWVSWGDAPGYVSWCPLGFDNRPVFSLSVSLGGGWRGDGWRGWTVLSRDRFGGRRNVHQFAVSPRSLPANLGFIAERSAPVAPQRAVPRRGSANDGQVAADRRQFPNVVGRTGDGRQPSAIGRRAGGGERPAEAQTAPVGRGRPITRSPDVVNRQRQVPSPSTPQGGPRPAYDGQNRAATRVRPPDPRTTGPTTPYDNRTNSARPGYERPSRPAVSAPPAAPVAPQRSERLDVGVSGRRADPIRPHQPAQPAPPEPRISRRAGGPIYTQRPSAPPPQAAPPPPPPREERAAPPRQERQTEQRSNDQRQNDQSQSRGREKQQGSSSDHQQDRGDGHHRR